MATTSIWSIKNNLKQSINYIINPEKTINKDYGTSSYSYLEIENTENNYKNEKVCYVSSMNCSERNPYEDMLFTKEEYGKANGILAFHGYQSFKEGEVTSDIAHEIGVKFAEEMFKDFEVVVATHQNTNHIHNHFIVNSVSFKNGKKYNNNRTNLAKLRHISDSLCAEYGLSTLDEDIGYKNTYKNKVLSDLFNNISILFCSYDLNKYDFEKKKTIRNNINYARCMEKYFNENNMYSESNSILKEIIVEMISYYANYKEFDTIDISLRGR